MSIYDVYTNPNNAKYFIHGLTSHTIVIPSINSMVQTYTTIDYSNIVLGDCYLLIDYIFLDEDERTIFYRYKHEYLIEQIILFDQITLDSPNNLINVHINHPCKYMVWMAQPYNNVLNNDIFNYTDSYKYVKNAQVGKSIVTNETIVLNSRERISMREFQYFNYLQPYQCFPYGPAEGINVYSFSLFADKFQPSGSCNMGQIDDIQISLQLNSSISTNNNAVFKGFAVVYNILRIVNGLSGLLFV